MTFDKPLIKKQAKMKNLINHPRFVRIFHIVKPWISALLFVAVLKYTGILSAVSSMGTSAVMKTGAMDFAPDESLKKDDFDYNFMIKDLQGRRIDFNDYKGKVLFINLWATWCGPCRVEMPSIQNLYSSLNNDSINFVMLSLDRDELRDKVVRFVQEKEYTFPVFMPTGSLPEQLQVSSIPTTFIVSRDGKIVSRKVGAANYDTDKFRKYLRELSKP